MYTNKRILMGVALVLAFAAFLPMAGAQATTTPQGALSITNLRVSPQPVIAGENITISFNLFNSYTSPLDNVNLYLGAQSRLINVTPSSSFLIDSIGTGIYGGISSEVFTYKIHVPSTLPEGEYTIDAIAGYKTTQSNGYVNYDVSAQSVMPIGIYVYGVPQIALNAVAQSQITPGHQFPLTISAVNYGSGTARNVSLYIMGSNDFSASGAEQFNLGIIQSGGAQSASATIFPAANIPGGTDYLPIKLSYTSDAGIASNTIVNVPIGILLNKPNIALSIVNAMPTQLNPGSNQTVTVLIQNIGTGQANNVSVQFLNGTGVSASGSASYFFIGSLPQGGEVTESVFVSANRDANQTNYSLPATIKYTYANYQNSTTQYENIPIRVQSGAIFDITAVNATLGPGMTYKPVVLTVKNIGNEAAQQITLSLQSIYPITPATPDAYVNYLAPGQSTNITFYVNIDSSGQPGTYPITLYEQWRQPNGAVNQQYSGSNSYYANVSNSSGSLGSYVGDIVGLVVVVIVALIAVRVVRSRKKPSKGKA